MSLLQILPAHFGMLAPIALEQPALFAHLSGERLLARCSDKSLMPCLLPVTAPSKSARCTRLLQSVVARIIAQHGHHLPLRRGLVHRRLDALPGKASRGDGANRFKRAANVKPGRHPAEREVPRVLNDYSRRLAKRGRHFKVDLRHGVRRWRNARKAGTCPLGLWLARGLQALGPIRPAKDSQRTFGHARRQAQGDTGICPMQHEGPAVNRTDTFAAGYVGKGA